MPTQTFILGMNAKLYQGEPGAELSALVEMSNVKDLTLTMEAGEADVTTRANSGWRATAATLKEATCEFEMLWKPGDDCFDAIMDAYLNSSQVRLCPMTGPRATAGSHGLLGDWSITNATRNEPLEEGITVSVTAKLAVFDEYVKVAS